MLVLDKYNNHKKRGNAMSKMTRWGVGPKFALLSISYAAITIYFTLKFPNLFKFKQIPISVSNTVGLILLVIGILFYISAIRPVMKAYSENKLYTKGAFAFCRHPIYSSWTLFIVPALNLFIQSSIGLTSVIVMYLLLVILTKEEDNYLENKYGQEFLKYKKKVPAVLPIGIFRK
jgi:Putative protein-S-isoprenylcysteine methyltransferase